MTRTKAKRQSAAKGAQNPKGDARAASPDEYIAGLPEPRRTEIAKIDRFIRKTLPKQKRHMAHGMLGYGPFHYKYASGREGDWFRIGLASQKQYISLYACGADERGYVAERYKALLPKASIGKSCVRFKRLDDLDLPTLARLLRETVAAGFGM
jgi:hypothetical protein